MYWALNGASKLNGGGSPPTYSCTEGGLTLFLLGVGKFHNVLNFFFSWSKTVGVFWLNAAETWVDISNAAADKVLTANRSYLMSVGCHVTSNSSVALARPWGQAC